MIRLLLSLVILMIAVLAGGGCALMHFGAVMEQNREYQMVLEVNPKYYGLEDKTVAVVVDADMSILYEHPQMVTTVTSGVTGRIGMNVPGVTMVPAAVIVAWQWRTPQWNAMAYGEIAESLNVDRVVYVDIYEYRLNPPGNRWMWEGVCAANVGVIERDNYDPDMFVESFSMLAEFPKMSNVDRSAATAQAIETGLLNTFIVETAWLFHKHRKPKHPDKYEGTVPSGRPVE